MDLARLLQEAATASLAPAPSIMGPAPDAAPPWLAPAVAPAGAAVEEPDAQSKASLAVLTQISLLAAAMVIGHVLSSRRISVIGDSATALLLGLITGIICYFADFSATFYSYIGFSKQFFFIALLPPIIFEAGYSLDTRPFIRNIGAICAYAFAGTAISTLLIGVIMWFAGTLRLCFRLTLVEALLYGAIISATDPVTVLSVFQQLHADEDLYALVFGESVLNDAVAITLYKTLYTFRDESVTFGAILVGFKTFCWTFVGSCMIGVGVGLASALAFKTRMLVSENKHSPLEANLVILFAFASYLIADGLNQSGIVSVLFCGMTMANYTRRNLTLHAQETSMAFFKIFANMAETFVFIYIGASLFLETAAWGNGLTWAFLVVALFALAVSRAANVATCTKAINLLRPAEMQVPDSHQAMLWWSGLRGAIAFALSLQAAQDFPGGKGEVMLSCTFVIILITVLVNGGGCAHLIERLHLRAQDDSHRGRRYNRVGHHEPDSGGSEAGDQPLHPSVFSLDGACDSIDNREQQQPAYISNAAVDHEQGPVDKLFGVTGADDLLHRGLESVRELNRNGIMPALSELDQRYLQPFFVADSAAGPDVEMAQARRRSASPPANSSTSSQPQALTPHDREPTSGPHSLSRSSSSFRGSAKGSANPRGTSRPD